MHFSKKGFLFFIISLFLALLACEGIVRLAGKYDKDANFYLSGRLLRPHKYPIEVAAFQLAKYSAAFSRYLVYDPDLGWSPQPLSVSNNGLYFYNADGIRASSCDVSIPKEPEAGVLRIALFGDSFTHGDDVHFNETWGYLLQENLRRAGINAEVINFGVGSYGVDQAYLRWKKLGFRYAPHVVILGFVSEDVLRDVNVLRPFFPPAWGEGIPFSKPRFILENGKLKLVNVPALPPQQMVDVLRNPASWGPSKYEYWLQYGGFKESIWLKSKLLCLILDSIELAQSGDRGRGQFLRRGTEPFNVTLAVIDEFHRDVAARGALFYVAYLPDMAALLNIAYGVPPQEKDLLDELARRYQFIFPGRELFDTVEKADRNSHVVRHYNPEEGELIARGIAQYLEKDLLRRVAELAAERKSGQ